MASLNYSAHTKNPSRGARHEARVLPAALREDEAYKEAYDERVLAHHDLFSAIAALNSARNQIKSHEKFQQLSSDQHQGSLYTPLSDAALKKLDKKIAEAKTIINEEHGKFAAAHQRMRDMEQKAVAAGNLNSGHRLARTSTFPNRGQMYGKFGIYNINASHIAEKDKMEPVSGDHEDYMKGGRRKKTRKKRRRKNKRKTKRRKKTRRRKKRRKKRRTKRR
jgi:hypothetical protein